jgi:hypothetical protein
MTVSDLSPDALARLEAKLIADLDMVRKVRALLEEHRGALGGLTTPGAMPADGGTTQTTAHAPPFTAIPPPLNLPTYEEALSQSLLEMPDSGFKLKMLCSAMGKKLRNFPDGTEVKKQLSKLIRKGQVIVVESQTGRSGSTYRCLIPKPEPTFNPQESAIHPEDSPI